MVPTGKGREGTGNAKKCQITLKGIIKAIISYLILSVSLFGFSVVTSLGSGTVGKGRDGKSQLWSRPVSRRDRDSRRGGPGPWGSLMALQLQTQNFDIWDL